MDLRHGLIEVHKVKSIPPSLLNSVLTSSLGRFSP